MAATEPPGQAPSWARTVAGRPFPRVVATDLDGTLLRRDGTVSDYTLAVLADYVAAGGEYVLVTARPPRWLWQLAHVVPAGGVVLAGNGAFEVDVGAEEVVQIHGFAPDEAARLVHDLVVAFPEAIVAVETSQRMVYDDRYGAEYWQDPGEPVHDLGDWLDAAPEIAGKILLRELRRSSREAYDAVGRLVGERGVLAYSGAPGLVEISPPGVTKACALERWCRERRIGEDAVWAFGDMPNDLPMLSWAGTAYAVANAHPDVIAAATAVAPHHEEDGVAQVLAAAVRRVRGVVGRPPDGT